MKENFMKGYRNAVLCTAICRQKSNDIIAENGRILGIQCLYIYSINCYNFICLKGPQHDRRQTFS